MFNQFIYKRNFNENSLNLFKQKLFETSWVNIKSISDPNEAYDKFLNYFSELYESYFPLEKIKVKPKRIKSNSIMNGIAKSSKCKQKLYEKFLKNRTEENKIKYKNYKNLFKMIKQKSKKKTLL